MNELQWTNETHFFIKIYLSHFILERGTQFESLRDRWRDIYSERGDFLPHIFFLEREGANTCTTFASHIIRDDLMPLISFVSLA